MTSHATREQPLRRHHSPAILLSAKSVATSKHPRTPIIAAIVPRSDNLRWMDQDTTRVSGWLSVSRYSCLRGRFYCSRRNSTHSATEMLKAEARTSAHTSFRQSNSEPFRKSRPCPDRLGTMAGQCTKLWVRSMGRLNGGDVQGG